MATKRGKYRMVADACAAIERHYFPPKPEGNNAKPTQQ